VALPPQVALGTGAAEVVTLTLGSRQPVTLSTGLICSEGKELQRLQVGDTVHIPASEVHWHGATNTTIMAHTAILLGSTTTRSTCGLSASNANYESFPKGCLPHKGEFVVAVLSYRESDTFGISSDLNSLPPERPLNAPIR
jgi:hypothetical protein